MHFRWPFAVVSKVCLLVGAMLVLYACDGTDGYIGPELPAEQIERGRLRFLANCSSCHGVDATGVGGRPNVRGKSAAQITQALATVTMMRHIDLTPDEVTAIAAYLNTLNTTVAVQTLPNGVQNRFASLSAPRLGLQWRGHAAVSNLVTEHLLQKTRDLAAISCAETMTKGCRVQYPYYSLSLAFEALNQWLPGTLTPRAFAVTLGSLLQNDVNARRWLKALEMNRHVACLNAQNPQGLPLRNDFDQDCFPDIVGAD